jgi:2-hydroxychromene-2-carboxylate isomerase
LGLDVREFSKLLTSEEVRTGIETNCLSAVDKGVFGTPTFFVGSKMFWGNDRIPLVRHALDRLAKGNERA